MTFETFDQNDERTWTDQKKDNDKDKYTDKDNDRENPRDLWQLRHWLQFWQLRTWIHDNLCYLTIKRVTLDSIRNSCNIFVDIGIQTIFFFSFPGCKAGETIICFFFPGRSSLRYHNLDPGVLSCLPSKVPDENHIWKSESDCFLVKFSGSRICLFISQKLGS